MVILFASLGCTKGLYRIAGKFGGELNLSCLPIYLCNHQIKIRQCFILAYIRMVISYRTPKFINPPKIFYNGNLGPNCQILFPPIFPAIWYMNSLVYPNMGMGISGIKDKRQNVSLCVMTMHACTCIYMYMCTLLAKCAGCECTYLFICVCTIL